MKFYICNHCGNLIEMVQDSGVNVVCCGEKMTELVPNTRDGAKEKHIPVWEVEDNKVKVNIGEINHPMTPEHYIQWVALETKKGIQRKELLPNSEPHVCFHICKCDEVVAVYAYCNLHGLYKK